MSTTPVRIGSYVTTKAPTAAEKADRAFHACCQSLLDASWAAVDARAATAKATRLAERMDRLGDAYPHGTPERGEAETVHALLIREAKRHTATVRRAAKRVAELWSALTPDYERIVLVEIMPGWPDDPVWAVIRLDPILGRDPVWARLLAAATGGADPANDEPCPF
jgi:hypothetical protein